ncbi:EAL domain-containing protein (putative c-di-GMP-specific phosphodiesterase class I)/CheY-like chemotaxis protein [Limibacillus sp. MBR-115]|jgi:EAL domain-containing protein (putative c-di-GMP-specific phosphodiesterase class I)/CheY-like chemotaxis protein
MMSTARQDLARDLMTPQEANVLIVDDNPLLRRAISTCLRKAGFSAIEQAENGATAADKLGHCPVDVIICDINMPEMDGIEFIRHLAEIDFPGGLLMVTGEEESLASTVSSMIHACRIDFLGLLLKPFDTADLLRLLAAYEPKRVKGRRGGPRQLSKEQVVAEMDSSLDLFMQPKVSLRTGAVTGIEFLARWRTDEGKWLTPASFIPTCEENGLMDQLTERVIDRAFEIAKSLGDGQDTPFFAINISAATLVDLTFPDRLQAKARKFDLSLDNFILEITEASILGDLRRNFEVLSRLRLKRITLAIDDFGTGHSTLTQLQHVPASELKLDRSYVSLALADHRSRAILESAVSLARKLGMRTVAEGVETKDIMNLTRDLGVDDLQGFLICPPISEKDYIDWRQDWTTDKKRFFAA